MNFLDVILVLMLGWAVFRGYRRGFLGTLAKFAGYMLALVITAILYWPLQIFLSRQMHLVDKLSPRVVSTLQIPAASQQIASFPIDYAIDMVNQREIPGAFKEIMIKYIQDFANLPATKGITTLGEGIGYIISDFMVSALSFVVLAAVLSVIFGMFLPRLFRAAARPISTPDKVIGAVVGLAGGLLSITALVIVLTPLASIGALKGNPSPMADQVHASFMVNAVIVRLQSLFEMIFASKGF